MIKNRWFAGTRASYTGVRLVICAREPQELERSRLEVEQRGGEVLAVPCDVTDKIQVEQII